MKNKGHKTNQEPDDLVHKNSFFRGVDEKVMLDIWEREYLRNIDIWQEQDIAIIEANNLVDAIRGYT